MILLPLPILITSIFLLFNSSSTLFVSLFLYDFNTIFSTLELLSKLSNIFKYLVVFITISLNAFAIELLEPSLGCFTAA